MIVRDYVQEFCSGKICMGFGVYVCVCIYLLNVTHLIRLIAKTPVCLQCVPRELGHGNTRRNASSPERKNATRGAARVTLSRGQSGTMQSRVSDYQ